jgi:hypothetical protein
MPKQAAALAVYELTNAVPQVGLEQLRRLTTSRYLDDQDCKYVGGHRMLCSGVTEMRVTSDTLLFRLVLLQVRSKDEVRTGASSCAYAASS